MQWPHIIPTYCHIHSAFFTYDINKIECVNGQALEVLILLNLDLAIQAVFPCFQSLCWAKLTIYLSVYLDLTDSEESKRAVPLKTRLVSNYPPAVDCLTSKHGVHKVVEPCIRIPGCFGLFLPPWRKTIGWAPRAVRCKSVFHRAKRSMTPSSLQPSLTHRRLFKIMCWGTSYSLNQFSHCRPLATEGRPHVFFFGLPWLAAKWNNWLRSITSSCQRRYKDIPPIISHPLLSLMG